MMYKYLKAENLKYNRTFVKKLIFIAPIFTFILALLIGGKYFEVSSYNWWYALILPGHVALVTALVNQKEQKKLRYRAVFALPVSLKKVWIVKVLLIGSYITLSCIVLVAGIYLGGIVRITNVPISKALFAAVVMALTCLWQIPICLFISKKIGTFATISINVVGAFILGFKFANKALWWASPYSWTLRLMTPIIGVLPNGCLAEKGNVLLNSGVIPTGIILSIILFVILLIISAYWFQNQEIK